MIVEEQLEVIMREVASKTEVRVSLQFLRETKERIFELQRQIDAEREFVTALRGDIAEVISNIERGMLVNAEQIADVLRTFILGENDAERPTEDDSAASDQAMAEIGHNSIAASALENLLIKIEKLREERADINSDIRDVFEEAKAAKFDGKTIRRILAWRAMPEDEREQQRRQLEIYAEALGLNGIFG